MELFKSLPECIDYGGERIWLHLQPTLGHKTYNAFYGSVTENGWVSTFHAEGDTPEEALQELKDLLGVRELLKGL